MSDLTGKTLGRYRIVERIGRGGMADVYKAYQPSLDRYVAIKVLHPFLLEEDGSRERFQREARAVAALRHPNIVQVFDFDTEGDDYFMVMEYIDGPNLKTVLLDEAKAGRRLALDRIEEITTAIGGALAYAHHQGMIHRDIKPHNIMFTSKGQPLLTDFGIAKIVSGSGSMLSMSGALTGTPAYMSPEQGRGAPLDSRTDIYSFGVVLYEMITGRVPFDADTPFAVVIKHISDPLPLPHTLRPDVPDALERVVLKAMAKEPDERYQTVEELVRGVQQAIAVARTTELSPADAGTPATALLADDTTPPGVNTLAGPGASPPTPTLPTMPVAEPQPSAPQTTPVTPVPVPATALLAEEATPVPATALLAEEATLGPVPPAPPPPRPNAMASLSIGKVSCSMMVGVAVLVLVAVSSLAFLNLGKGAPPGAVAVQPTPPPAAAGPPVVGAEPPTTRTEAAPTPLATPPPGDDSPTAPPNPPATVGPLPTFTTLADALAAGEQLLGDEKYAEALAAFNAALGIDLTSGEALRGIGQAQLGLRNYQEALDALNGAIAVLPDDLTTLLARSRAYLGVNDWTRAYDDANKAYAMDPDSVEALILRARANGLRGDPNAALADYQTALTAHPDEPDIYQDRGEWYLDQRKGAEAVADFQKALELSPDDPILWHDLGRAYVSFGGDLDQPDKSIEAFTRAIQLDNDYQRAYHDRGWIYVNYKGDYGTALADYNRAVQIGPGYAELYLDRAYCYLQMHNSAGELADLNSAVAIEPNNDYALERRFEYYYYATQYDLALADINKALELAPDYQAYHLFRSNLYLVLNQAAEAQGDAQFVVTANPTNPAGHLALARALVLGNDNAGALAQVEQALAINDPSSYADALVVRGWIAYHADEQDKAAADFAEAVKAAPYNPWALFGQAAVDIKAQRYAEALPKIETGIGQDNRYGLGYVLRAAVAAGQDQKVKAVADLQQAQQRILYPAERQALEDLRNQLKP